VRLLQNPSGVFAREKSEYRSQEPECEYDTAQERDLILNPEYWLLNTALAEPTKEVLQAPRVVDGITDFRYTLSTIWCLFFLQTKGADS
jgi:hypothetical protein